MTPQLVAVEQPRKPKHPKCGRLGCVAPGTVVTVLRGGVKVWNLYHCVDHPDGLEVAAQLGFAVSSAAA